MSGAQARLLQPPNRAPALPTPGLKLGIYSDSGLKSCTGYTGSLGFEVEDAKRFAAWGGDLLEYDNCYSTPQAWCGNLPLNMRHFAPLGYVRHKGGPGVQMPVQARYEAMRDALNATGRPNLLSMCEWGVSNPWLYAP